MIFRRSKKRAIDPEEVAREMVSASDLFDAEWYLSHYPDVARAGFDAALHYVRHGAAEGRDPGPWFDTRAYLKAFGTQLKGANPLVHYLTHKPSFQRDVGVEVRGYADLAGMLRATLVNPVITAPFAEEDRRCFAVMEAIARQLAARAGRESSPKVSVIMPFWNRAGTLRAAIDSVLAQKYQNFELILIDDGSTDEGVEVATRATKEDPRLRLFQLGSHVGVSAARNRGLEFATGDIIAYLDSDNLWLPDYLGAAVGAFDILAEATAIYSGQYLYGTASKQELTAVRFGPMNGSLLEQRNYIDLNCFVHRRAIVDRGISFDLGLTRLVDWDFILKVYRNFRMVSVPVILSQYFYHAAENTITKTQSLDTAFREIVTSQNQYCEISGSVLTRNVCVVIPSFQVVESLRECVASILPYLKSGIVEVVIVDNNSKECVRDFLRTISHPRIKIIHNSENYGFSYAVNQGVAASSPDADILILNNDAELAMGSIEALQAAAYEEDGIGITVPRQIVPPGLEDTVRHVPYANPDLPCDVTLSSHHDNVAQIGLFHDGRRVDLSFAPFFCAYVKRSTWERCGGLDHENGRHYRSDRIMCAIVKQFLGQRIVYTPEAKVYHKVQAATKALSDGSSDDKNQYREMLLKNAWPPQLMHELGIYERPWWS